MSNEPSVWIADSAVRACPRLFETEGAVFGHDVSIVSELAAPRLAVAATPGELARVRTGMPAAERVMVVGGAVTAPDFRLASRFLTSTAGPQDIYALQGLLGSRPWAAGMPDFTPGDLPPLGGTVSQLMEVLNDPNCGRDDVLRLMERDPALVARTLKVANSSYFGLPRRIARLDRAVVIMGLAMLKGVVLAGTMPVLFREVSTQLLGNVQERGLLASQLLRRLGGAHAATASTAGILLDIGQLVLAREDPQRYEAVLAAGPMAELPLRELRTYGASHAEVGASLLEAWGLPDEIVHSVGLSHTGLPHPSTQKSTGSLVRLAAMAIEQAVDGAPPTTPRGWAEQMRVDLDGLTEEVSDLTMQWPAA